MNASLFDETLQVLLGLFGFLIPILLVIGSVLLFRRIPGLIYALLVTGSGGQLVTRIGYLPPFLQHFTEGNHQGFFWLQGFSFLSGSLFAVGFVYLALYVARKRQEEDILRDIED